jgi:uncharacterized protein (DUF433 family)
VTADVNLLTTGIYTVSEAAYLVGVSKQRVRGWVSGYPRRSIPPIIDNEVGWVDDRVAFSFTNLMEIRFVAFFENLGIKLPVIRGIMQEAKDLLDHPHPFATHIIFRTDGRKIVAEIARKRSGKLIYDLKTKNYEMRTVVLDSLKDDVWYDAEGTARFWYPRQRIAPNVIVHPRFSFGRPILRDSRIPTSTLADAVHAEGSTRSVATWYEVPEKQVREALRFETVLRKAA